MMNAAVCVCVFAQNVKAEWRILRYKRKTPICKLSVAFFVRAPPYPAAK